MATIITGEDYEKFFDHELYVTNTYDKADTVMQGIIDFVMNNLHEAFTDIKKNQTLLDIGSGPCIHTVISASNKVDEIYMSDYSQRNINRLNSWLKGEIDIQTKQIKYVCQLEDKGQTVEERANQMRNKVKQVCFIDVTKPESLTGSDVPKQFNVVTSSWCLDSCGQPIETYKTCATYIAALVKINGYFLLIGDLNCTLYTMENNDKLPSFEISEPSVRKIYEDLGFKILTFKTHPFVVEWNKGPDTKVFFMFAQKIK